MHLALHSNLCLVFISLFFFQSLWRASVNEAEYLCSNVEHLLKGELEWLWSLLGMTIKLHNSHPQRWVILLHAILCFGERDSDVHWMRVSLWKWRKILQLESDMIVLLCSMCSTWRYVDNRKSQKHFDFNRFYLVLCIRDSQNFRIRYLDRSFHYIFIGSSLLTVPLIWQYNPSMILELKLQLLPWTEGCKL